jgi:uncharacterized cofD-like protein
VGISQAPRRIVRGLKWLAPGLRVKRWLLLVPVGLAFVIVGVVLIAGLQTVEFLSWLEEMVGRSAHVQIGKPIIYLPVGATLIVVGLLLILGALIAVNRSIVSVVAPDEMTDLASVIARKRGLAQGARIVVIGGGTGLSTLLRGLKQYTSNLTAVVTMTDDGGSSGLLQKQMVGSILPPGDIRNCLVALADAEPLMQQLFQYRFATRDARDGLSGHSFGNLLIAAMADITGDFEQAVEKTSEILAIRGRVLPSTTESVVLVGEMEDGREVTGETSIASDPTPIRRIKLCPDHPRPLPEVLTAIREADLIVLGPGSVFTSIVPNLLVPEITHAVARSRAVRCYVCNVMTQKGETDGYTASAHLRTLDEHVAPLLGPGQHVVDYVLVNTAEPSGEAVERYARAGAVVVTPDLDEIKRMGYQPISGTFISENAVVRHDADHLALALLKLWQRHR